MSDSSTALLIAFLIISALCALAAYTVRRVGSTAPGRLAVVLGALAAFAAVMPAVILALRATVPGTGPGAGPAPTASVDAVPASAPPTATAPPTGGSASAFASQGR